jgi:hypothetical protein
LGWAGLSNDDDWSVLAGMIGQVRSGQVD